MNSRIYIAAIIIAVGFAMNSQTVPSPAPAPSGGLDLRGLFVGETAAEDAAVLSALCAEIADEIEWDGRQADPLLTSGVAFDTLRTRARDARLKGESIGDRQPRIRSAVSDFLDEEVGSSGGPVDAGSRASWVRAYRTIAEACRNAIIR